MSGSATETVETFKDAPVVEARFACTEAYRLWVASVHLSMTVGVDLLKKDGAFKAACDAITPPEERDIGLHRGELAFVLDGLRHWFAHKNGRALPLLWAVFVEGGSDDNPIDVQRAHREALSENALIVTQEELNRMAEAAT